MTCIYEKIIVVGSGTLTHKIAAFLQVCGVEILVLEKEANGYTFLSRQCSDSGIKYYAGNGQELQKIILSHATKSILVISASNKYVFSKEVVNHPNIRIINYHNSKLPEYRGMNAEAWQIYSEEKEAGVTWHFVDDRIDKGDIITQLIIPLNNSITSIKLLKLQGEIAYDLFLKFYKSLLDGSLMGIPQKNSNTSRMYCTKDVPNGGFLELSWKYNQISAFLRAMDYGKLKVLGNGKIVLNGQTYCWNRYRFGDSVLEREEAYIDSDRITISKENHTIILEKCTAVKK